MKTISCNITFLFILFLTLNFSDSKSQSNTRHVLFLGNSYTYVNNLPQIISNAALSTGDTLVFDSNTPGGYTLDMHWADSNSLHKIMAGGWDYVVMQEQSQLPSFDQYFSTGAERMCKLTREYNPCARKMFYMTWGRKNGDAGNCPFWPPICTYSGMDSLLRLRYIEMANYDNAEISPVGAVWKYIRQNFPSIELYQADESHPSEAGSYAAACCFYSAIFKKDPTLISFNYTLSPTDAANIRTAAKTIMYDSLSYWDFANHEPAPDFSYVIGGGLNEAVFTNHSSLAESYLWDFGDGDTSTLENPVHNYLADGTYTITLTAYSCDLDSIHLTNFQKDITFCAHNPTITPNNLFVCPYSTDSLWTQAFDSYQWYDDYGIAIPGETNQNIKPIGGYKYSVLTTLNGCTEMSPQVFVDGYSIPFQLVFYHVDTIGTLLAPDTACIGDTLKLVLNSNKPDSNIKTKQWFKDGVPIPSANSDTIDVTTSGIYTVSVTYMVCPDAPNWISQPLSYTFVNCNFGIDENIFSSWIQVYYNPGSGNLAIKIKPELTGKSFSIIDISGRLILSGILDQEINNVALNKMNSGVYFLQVGNSTKQTIKFFLSDLD